MQFIPYLGFSRLRHYYQTSIMARSCIAATFYLTDYQRAAVGNELSNLIVVEKRYLTSMSLHFTLTVIKPLNSQLIFLLFIL